MLILQGERGLQTGRYRGMVSTGWGIAREEGVTALWKGWYSNIVFFSFCFLPYSVADPDPGSGAFLTPGSGMGKKSGTGSGMNNPDHISESLETLSWVENLNCLMRIRDPGWKKF
jgi:hypothetical protein